MKKTFSLPVALFLPIFLGVAVLTHAPALAVPATDAVPAEAVPVDDVPAEPAPAETSPPTAEPEAPATPDEPDAEIGPDEEDPDSDSNFVLWIGVIGLGIVAIACIAAIASSSSRRSQVRAANHQMRNRQLAEAVSSSRWVHDQSVTVLQIADPGQLRSAWGQMRNQILDVERTVATMSSRPEMASLARPMGELGSALSGLRSALEAFTTVASGAPASRDIVDNAVQTVQVRRRQLDVAMSNVTTEARMSG